MVTEGISTGISFLTTIATFKTCLVCSLIDGKIFKASFSEMCS